MRSHTHGFYGKLVGPPCAVCQRDDLKKPCLRFFISFQSYWSIFRGGAQFWALPNLTRHKKARAHFSKIGDAVFQINPSANRTEVPPTFHKIRVYATSFRRPRNFSKQVITRKYLFAHFRLTFWRIILLLSFQKIYSFMGFPLIKILRAIRLRKSITRFTLGCYLNLIFLRATKCHDQ